jgi:hypothetical protein
MPSAAPASPSRAPPRGRLSCPPQAQVVLRGLMPMATSDLVKLGMSSGLSDHHQVVVLLQAVGLRLATVTGWPVQRGEKAAGLGADALGRIVGLHESNPCCTNSG